MKKLALFAALAVLSFGATAVNAKEASGKSTKAAVKALANVPVAELPASAANLLTATAKEDRPAVVDAVIRKVARTHPVALRHVVAALSKADPALAPLAAGVAAKANPESVAAIATAACTAAPEKAAAILAVCSRLTAVSHSSLAEMVAQVNPAFSAQSLASQAEAVDLTAEASFVTGGTVILPFPPAPGTIGTDLNGNPVVAPPTATGPGTPGYDPDRYASAGS